MRHLILIIMTIGSLQAQELSSQLMRQHEKFKDTNLTHRRFKHQDILPLIEKLPERGFRVKEAGRSYQGRPIFLISIGQGAKSILLWSQMHGDEATATMALFDIFNYLSQSESKSVQQLLDQVTLHFIPMLNPDGAELFQRRTSQGIDMNRDALELECPESSILKQIRDDLQADFGFNLHDQSTYYTVGTTEKPATISFLAPAFNEEKEVNEKRGDAMKVIALMNETLQAIIPGQVGKYDDTFEPRAFGDNIQKWGTRTILVESGGYHEDPEKQFIRQLNFSALLTAFEAIGSGSYEKVDIERYWQIPMNRRNLNDLVIRNITVNSGESQPYRIDIAIQREELDVKGGASISYRGTIEDLGDLSTQYGYKEITDEGLIYAPGKVYPQSLKNQQAVKELGVQQLLSQGYTTIVLEDLPAAGQVDLPFELVRHRKKNPDQPAINQPATFLLSKDEVLSYVIINGLAYRNGRDY